MFADSEGVLGDGHAVEDDFGAVGGVLYCDLDGACGCMVGGSGSGSLKGLGQGFGWGAEEFAADEDGAHHQGGGDGTGEDGF